ncbi:MAG TPA: hypothetical protein VF629_22560 [Hymenobacter sp.]|jgi:hypothetical protein|uniref:hypothetical protein n=1 Tax=Hymenobacter sp. TaxID=1898978 RepID=UPI002ED9EA92
MEREEILVRFADLRRLASSIPDFVADKLGGDGRPTFQAAIEDDFGMVGLDTESLLLEFGETYRVDLTRFDFTGCISPEPLGNPLIVVLIPPYVALFALAWVTNAVAALCHAPFSLSKARLMLKAGIGDPATIARELLFPPLRPRPAAQILTVGDLVASAATGYFVKREKVRFVLAH